MKYRRPVHRVGFDTKIASSQYEDTLSVPEGNPRIELSSGREIEEKELLLIRNEVEYALKDQGVAMKELEWQRRLR